MGKPDDLVAAAFAEMNEDLEDEFKNRIRQKVREILQTQATITAAQAKLAEQQKELRTLELEVIDAAAVIGK